MRRALKVGLTACLLALPFVFFTTTFADEVTLLSHARRLLAGEVLYRDVFEFLAPLSSWAPAALFTLVTPSIQAARVLAALCVAVAAGCMDRLARQLGVTGWFAALPGLLLAGELYVAEPGYSHHWLVQPFLWGALLAASSGVARVGSRAPWGVAGAASGLAVLTMQSDGSALVATLVAWLALDVWWGKTPWREAGRRGAWLLAGLALPLGLAATYLGAQHALGAAYADVVTWPLSHYKTRGGVNDVKYLTDVGVLLATNQPGFRLGGWYVLAFFTLYVYLLPLVVGALVLARWGGEAMLRLRDHAPWRPEQAREGLVVLAFFAQFAVLLRGRADFPHAVYYLALPTFLGVLAAARVVDGPPGGVDRFVRWLAPGLLGGAAIASLVLRLQGLPATALAWSGPDGRMQADPVVVYLKSHARPGDRLAVFPLGGLYYFYALPPATRFTHMLAPQEGYYDADDYATFWREVKTSQARFLVLSPVASEVPPVVPATHYRLVADIPGIYLGRPSHSFVYEREQE